MTECVHGVRGDRHGSTCPQCAAARGTYAFAAVVRGLGVLALVAVVGVYGWEYWTTPAPPRDPVECGRLVLAVIEGKRKAGESVEIQAPPGCVTADFPEPYAVVNTPTGPLLMKGADAIAWFPPPRRVLTVD